MSPLNFEPAFDEHDTRPHPVKRPNRFVHWFLLLGTGVFLLSALVVLFWPAGEMPAPIVVASTSTAITPTEARPEELPTQEIGSELPPVVQPEQLSQIIQAPLNQQVFMSYRYEPFTTVNNERERTAFLDYVAVSGDTIESIASRYGLEAESVAWCNERRFIQVLRPDDIVKIPPMDGACYRVLGSREESLASIAADYKVEDPYTIIDSPANYGRLPAGIQPEDIVAGGTELFIPGGQGPVITWTVAEVQTDASGNVLSMSFAGGQDGSCGSITPSSGTYWGNPLPNGTWVRGFHGGHAGLDLAAPSGTPIYAANGGQVIFSGNSRWGYGQLVVIEHGASMTTLYGHMSARNVECGQTVATGQVIGYVGSTGISTGPHLHFEIQINGQAVDPSGTPGIGW